MIRINLLPVPKARQVRAEAEARTQFIVAGSVLIVISMFCGYAWFDLNKKINRLETEKTKVNKELNQLKEKVKEVANYEKNKESLEEKNRIIEQLKKNQSGPVHVLDEISQKLEPLKLWLVSMFVRGDNVELNGRAITNSDIVEFINQLKSSEYFKDVLLVESRQVMEANIPVYSFKLQATVVL
jgi:type IV pilus assembly protein PilN